MARSNMRFYDHKCNYATIIFGGITIEGPCSYWEVENGMMKLIIDGKQYATVMSNVLLEEKID